MVERAETSSALSPVKRALSALEDLRAKLDAVEAARREPIAIIGMGCRFPGGARSPEAYWRLLRNGVDAITEVPPERWDAEAWYDPDPETPGRISTRFGGFVEGIQDFDAPFFGVSLREARSLDPQQRLLLEVTWEALEDAGVAADSLAGSATGVFVGIGGTDYGQLLLARGPEEIDAYLGTGNAHAVASGRLSYWLGLQGPSLSVDTACSSSLVAVHLACQSLRGGECRMALVGGVSLQLLPEFSVNFSKARMLAPDGRCKTFDAAADGYVRSEGCGVIVCKRLSDARADGDRILAVIRGSAVNQDGRSSGLTVPNGPAQQAVIRKALESASVAPGAVSYVEAHGTGTSLGDPIEVQALASVFGERPRGEPLWIGSVKTNLGHLEAAAGMAGLLKVVLALRHRELPPHLHFHRPNPLSGPWEQLPLAVPTQCTPWNSGDSHRVAGVSAFGFSGTNAHVVLAEASEPGPVPGSPKAEPAPEVSRPLHLLTLSARSEEALRALADRYERHLAEHPDQSLADVCFSANTGRAHLSHRAALTAATPAEAREQLAALAQGQVPAHASRGLSGNRPPVAFLFTGQGSQCEGMGRRLYEAQPVFRKTLERCAALLDGQLSVPLLEVLYPAPGQRSPLHETAYTQPALFSLEYALAELWRSWGVVPTAVMGHSLGEYVAACVAGVFSLEDALRLVVARGRLMQALPEDGAMVAVETGPAHAASMMERWKDEVSIAAINAPASVVLSGRRTVIQSLTAAFQAQGLRIQPLTVSHAFHSPLMEPMLAAFEQVARGVHYAQPTVDLISNLTGELAGPEIATPGYWTRHVREPVRFADGMRTLHQQGHLVFVEVGPKPTLLGLGRQCLPESTDALWLPSLRADRDDWRQLLTSLCALYTRGGAVDWRGFDRGLARRKVPLPTYPFQRQRCWYEESQRPRKREARGTPSAPSTSRIVELLERGDVDGLSLELERSGPLAPEKRALLPDLLRLLVQRHRQEQVGGVLEDGCYRPSWRESDRPTRDASASVPGLWLVLADRTGVGEALAGLLRAQGHSCLLASQPPPDTAASELERLLVTAREPGRPPLVGVLHLWGLDAPILDERGATPEEDFGRCGAQVFHLVRALVGARSLAPLPRLWLVTRGAVSLEEPSRVALLQSPLWGIGQVLSREHPELWGGLVDLDPAAPGREVHAAWESVQATGGDDRVAFRQGRRYVCRLERIRPPSSRVRSLRADGTYLITGGLGALGLRVARWMSERGAGALVLLGRGSPDSATQESLERLREAGTRVHVAQVDVTDAGALGHLLESVRATLPPLRGVVHAAGIVDDGLLLHQSEERLTRVMAPKARGAWNLHLLTRGDPLDAFVLFAAGSALLGSPGQASYAAANTFLDALAWHRRALGLPALSLDWGPWAEAGMAVDARYRSRLEAHGLTPLSTEEGLGALERLWDQPSPQVAVLRVDWPTFRQQLPGGRMPLLAALDAAAPKEAPRKDSLLKQLDEVPDSDRLALLTRHVRELAARTLGRESSHPLELERGFTDLGMDSLLALELRKGLETSLGRPLPPTLVFEHPTISQLAAHLHREWVSGKPPPSTGAPHRSEPRSDTPPASAALVEQLSEEEVERLLLEKLARL
ncbi:type I polyketide synthase [Corallococcus silvisoli]|uniref:type I polyketide synthase n=1 Tax=Corallococcus silvisoli TaxID=2697031 RepID=UPI001378887F|nr:type I polyketide synthase [Corallococcus silvisoli]NBD13838.1 SDR family NAD(P)-dependent oxidoreductase [Corallococcus silvisoli]